MTIDIRADVYCSLGPVISGSFSDDYIQDSGLIKTRGEVVLNGVFRPAAGTVVEFAYVRNGVGSRLPRKLRVLSVFADPYRNTTSIALGCKLTYLEGRKPPLRNPTSIDENGQTPPDVLLIASLPINASYVLNQCLTEIDLEASDNPLTNKFSVEEFSMDSGYIAVISDLLKSEGYFGYINEEEILVISKADEEGGLGPLITSDSIIDVAPIDVGELPGESVVVGYNYLRLAPPPPPDEASGGEGEQYARNYTVSRSTGSVQEVELTVVTERNGSPSSSTFSGSYTPFSETRQTYSLINVKDPDTGQESKKWVVTSARQNSNGHWFEAAASINTGYIQSAFPYPPLSGTYEKTISTDYSYDIEGNVISETATERVPQAVIHGSTPVPWKEYFAVSPFRPSGGLTAISSKTVTTSSYNKKADTTSTTTFSYKAKAFTSESQNAYARQAEEAKGLGGTYLSLACYKILLDSVQLAFDESTTNLSIGRGQIKPAGGADAGSGGPQGPLIQENTAGLEWIDGSAESQLVTQFSVPYSGDDYLADVSGSGETLTFTIVRSDAAVKARNFGNLQNRFLLGNRNGLSIQISADSMPPSPFAPIYIEANGFVGQYKTNGTSYTFDANGIVASTDALFWGAVGAL
jgi:hypothetical protein